MQGVKKNNGTRGVSWTAVVEGERDPVTGKRKQIKRTFRTSKEAKDWRTKTLHELRTGAYIQDSLQTVEEFLNQWLDTIKPTVRESTLRRYRQIVAGHIVPALGRMQLSRLSPSAVQQFYSAELATGLSRRTVSMYHMVLSQALSQAVKWELLYRNPCVSVEPPTPENVEMKTWNPEQVRSFLEYTADDSLAALWRLALMTGMRCGELLALRWQDVDLDNRQLSVRRTVTRGTNGLTFGEPKSNSGKRSIALPLSSVETLRARRRGQSETRLGIGPLWEDTDLVFDRGTGEILHPNVVRRRFTTLSDGAGLPRIRFHDLRHTAATLMLSDGVHPKVVAERLGHSDISMTMNLYSHVTSSMQMDAADRLDKMLAG